MIGLREAHCQHKRNSHSPQLSAGDIVIIDSDNQPRGMWKLGRVEELLTGPDGESRAAVLQVAGQRRSAKYLRHPVQRLYPLRCHSLLTRQVLLLTEFLIRPLTLREMGRSHHKMKKVDLTTECDIPGGQQPWQREITSWPKLWMEMILSVDHIVFVNNRFQIVR